VRDFGLLGAGSRRSASVELAAGTGPPHRARGGALPDGLSGLWSVITATPVVVPWKSVARRRGDINLSGVFLLVLRSPAIALARGFGQRHLHRAPWLVLAIFRRPRVGTYWGIHSRDAVRAAGVDWVCLTALVIAVLCRSMARSRALTSRRH